MSWCKLTPLYSSEPSDYHLLSTCIFVKKNYIKTTKGIVKNMASIRKEQFIRNLKKHIQHYDNGYWTDKFRLRIHIDDSFENDSDYSSVFKEYKDHPFIQWVKYDLPNFKYPSSKEHIGLIGTLIRFHPLFFKNDNINCISVIDIDNWYTNKWKDEIDKFKHSNYDIHTFTPILPLPFYASIIPGISNETPTDYWLAAGLFSSKIYLPSWRWAQLPEYINTIMLPRLRFLDSFKMAIYDNKTDQMMEDYEYGMDEMYLNKIVNYYIEKKHYKLMKKTIITNPNPATFLSNKILDYIQWNDLKTYRVKYLYDALHVKDFNHLSKKIKHIKSINELIHLFRPTIDILKTLQFDQRIVYVIENLDLHKHKSYNNLNEYLI